MEAGGCGCSRRCGCVTTVAGATGDTGVGRYVHERHMPCVLVQALGRMRDTGAMSLALAAVPQAEFRIGV